MPRRRGFLLTFEGVDGAGKSTQLRKVAAYLRREGYRFLIVREPGGTVLSERIRRLLLDRRATHLSDESELFLYLAARAQLVHELIAPALARGEIVLCDRFTDSTLAYQGGGRGFAEQVLRELNDVATGGRHPDLTILLDVPRNVSAARKSGTPDRLESEKERFHRRVLQRYRRLARTDRPRFVRVDGTGDVEAVFAQIRRALEARLPKRR
jgi:dTMP kinase